jgi:hypothetical protein
MTVSTSVYKAGPYAGSGTTGPFTVTFRFLANSHLRVIKTSTTGSETTLNLGVDYSVTGAGGASGTVTLTSPLLTGERLTIVRNVPLTQETDYVANDSFPAESHEQALDKLTMITQQLAEEVDRAVKVLPSSTDDPDALIASIKTSEQNAAASAASAAASYDQFDDRYLGAKTSNPTLDNDGNALQVGAEYWNSVSNERRTWTGSAWVSSITVVPDNSVTTGKIQDTQVTYNKLGSDVTPILTGRNKIINGKMEIAQRGTTFGTSSLDGSYTLDRWVIGNSSTASLTVTSTTDVPASYEFRLSLQFVATTADTSIAAGDQAIIQQNIEGFNARDLVGRTFTLSFWVRSSVTGTYCVALRNSVFAFSYVLTYTINAVDTWEYKTVTVTSGLPAPFGTWNSTNGVGLRVAWTLAAGSTFQTTAGAWQTGNFLGTSAQVNFLAAAANTFYLTGVQLEVGSVATPFEHRPYGMELALCQRYYQINSAAFTSNVTSGIGYGAWTSFPVQMRVAPTGAFVSSISAVSFPSTAGVFNLAPRVDGYLYEKTANATSGGRFLDSLSFTSEL